MNEAISQRRLLAIVFTDVAHYTAATEPDEAAAVRVRDRHRELVRASRSSRARITSRRAPWIRG